MIIGTPSSDFALARSASVTPSADGTSSIIKGRGLAAILPAVAIAAGGAVVVVEPDIAAKPADDNPIPRLVVPGLPARHGGAAMAAEAVIDRWPIIGRLIAALNGLIGRKPAQA